MFYRRLTSTDPININKYKAKEVNNSAWGGMFFHKSLIDKIGLPNEDYFIFLDDYEFSHRINSFGGKIYLLPNCLITDIDYKSYSNYSRFTNLIRFEKPERVYYAARNHFVFERKYRCNNVLIFYLNVIAFIKIGFFFSLFNLNFSNFKTILIAIFDGIKGNLGENKDFACKLKMNVSVVLDYFKYFIPFSTAEDENKYFYVTQRHRFGHLGIKNLIKFSYNSSKKITSDSLIGYTEYYFKATKLLKAISPKVEIIRLSAAYEDFYQRYFEKNKIELLISGGVTGFERCALFIARKLGIKTMCVWEGFFRPSTISYDSLGMNAESKFNLKSWNEIESHVPSKRFVDFYNDYASSVERKTTKKINLRDIQKDKFNSLHQLRNRFLDRSDIERIRLPIKRTLNSSNILFHI